MLLLCLDLADNTMGWALMRCSPGEPPDMHRVKHGAVVIEEGADKRLLPRCQRFAGVISALLAKADPAKDNRVLIVTEDKFIGMNRNVAKNMLMTAGAMEYYFRACLSATLIDLLYVHPSVWKSVYGQGKGANKVSTATLAGKKWQLYPESEHAGDAIGILYFASTWIQYMHQGLLPDTNFTAAARSSIQKYSLKYLASVNVPDVQFTKAGKTGYTLDGFKRSEAAVLKLMDMREERIMRALRMAAAAHLGGAPCA